MYTMHVRIEREKIQGRRKLLGMPAGVCDLQATLLQ
jgi:hypothetical protein